MQKNFEDFSMQEAMRLAKSPAGQELLALLQRTDGDALTQAMRQASGGDYESAAGTVRALLSSPEAQALLAQLGGR